MSRSAAALLIASALVVSTRWFGVSAYAGGWSAGVLCGQAWAEHDTGPDSRWSVGFQVFETPEFRWEIPGRPVEQSLVRSLASLKSFQPVAPPSPPFLESFFRRVELGLTPGGHRQWLLILWPLAAAAAALGLGISAWGAGRRRARRRRGACPACGYDLRTVVGGVCPECGPPNAAGQNAP